MKLGLINFTGNCDAFYKDRNSVVERVNLEHFRRYGPQPAIIPHMFTILLSLYQLENLYKRTDFAKPTPQDAPGHRSGTMTTDFGVQAKFTYDGAHATFNIVQNPDSLTDVAIKAQIERDAEQLGLTPLPAEEPHKTRKPANV